MKRIAVWVFYGIGTLAIAYLAFYAYAAFTEGAAPGDPIRIFRKPTGVELTSAPLRTPRRGASLQAIKPPPASDDPRRCLRA